jgi:hypothetical protein
MSKPRKCRAGQPAGAEVHERRQQARCPFTASVDVIESRSQTKISGRTCDVSRGGCYIDTINSFPVGSTVQLQLVTQGRRLEAQAEVAYCLPGMGMGVQFKAADPQQIAMVNRWMTELCSEQQTEGELPEVPEEYAGQTGAGNDEMLVLRELVVAIMRQGLLPEAKCASLLEKLNRSCREQSSSEAAATTFA